jgi:site-specific recombinase XerD
MRLLVSITRQAREPIILLTLETISYGSVSTNQKMNKGLKYLAKLAGITKDMHMHLARYTFSTTVTLANGAPIETVSKMLGHASIKQTQHYAKVVPLKIKFDMEKIRDLYR